MRIVICGAGKVGEVLCRDLSKEDHDIVIIDKSEKRVQQMINMTDITGFSGNAALYDVQMEADVASSDIFIAVTPDDEVNIIAAITASKLGAGHIVARVRSPEYSRQMEFLKDSMGITLMINPEFETATEIARILEFPTALGLETFGHGRMNLVEFVLENNSSLVSKTLREIGRKYGDVLICIVVRHDEASIPDGKFVLKAGDRLYLSGAPNEVRKFCQDGQKKPWHVSTALVVGGGRITRYLLPKLEKMHIRCRVIEAKETVSEMLSVEFPNIEIICGDGTNQILLKEERIQNFDALISLTGIDEENILLSIYAAKQGVAKTITKVNRTDLLKILDNVGLQSIVTPHRIIANQIIRFVRSIENSQGSNIEAFYKLADGQAEALQFHVREGSAVCHKTLQDLSTKNGVLITSIFRKGSVIYPSGTDMILPGDEVVVVTKHPNFQDISDILRD